MKYIFLLLLLCFFGWLGYRAFQRKLRALRGQPEPESTAPRSVKLLALAIVVVYGLWITVRLVSNY